MSPKKPARGRQPYRRRRPRAEIVRATGAAIVVVALTVGAVWALQPRTKSTTVTPVTTSTTKAKKSTKSSTTSTTRPPTTSTTTAKSSP